MSEFHRGSIYGVTATIFIVIISKALGYGGDTGLVVAGAINCILALIAGIFEVVKISKNNLK